MQTSLFRLSALSACSLLIASCAGLSRPPADVPPPRLSIPTEATTACQLPTLPERPTLADLEAAYVARGVALLRCDGARELGVETLRAERELQDRWREQQTPSRSPIGRLF